MFDTLDRLKADLPKETALIGFCGAPWTVASYMIAGRGTPDQAPARLFAYRHPDLFARLIDRLVDASAEYLRRQFAAGADAAQIFDSWAGVLPPAEFERWCLSPIKAIAAKVRADDADDAAHRLSARRRDAACQIQRRLRHRRRSASTPPRSPKPPSPLCPRGSRSRAISIRWRWLRAGGARRANRARADRLPGRAHIFNLGHGIVPETPVEHVERLVARVRGQRTP